VRAPGAPGVAIVAAGAAERLDVLERLALELELELDDDCASPVVVEIRTRTKAKAETRESGAMGKSSFSLLNSPLGLLFPHG